MKRLKGTTLIEVMAGIALIAIISLFVYTGICAGTNLITHGADYKAAETAAAETLERAMAAKSGGTSLVLKVQITDEAGTTRQVSMDAVHFSATDADEMVTYDCYLPPVREEEAP